jgi:hypothetical protein
MAVHSPLNAFSFDISLIEIGQEIKLLEHLKKKMDHSVFCIILINFYKVHSINIWTVKIKIAVVRLVKSLVTFILPSCYQ